MKKKHLLNAALAFLAFTATARENPEAEPNASHDPLRRICLESRGIHLEYTETGRRLGHPVIFLHGFTDSWFSFSRIMPLLPTGIRAFYLTQRGHGDSDKPDCCYTQQDFVADLLAFMDQKSIAKATIVGHSMGSFIAHHFAIEHPERVEGLVLIGSSAKAGNPGVVDFNAFVQGLDEITPQFAKEFQVSTLCVPVPGRFLETVVGESLKVPLYVWKDALQGLVEEDHAFELENILAPTLVIGGLKDPFFPAEDQLTLASTVASGGTVLYADLCHAPHWEDPVTFAEDLLQFLRGEVRVQN